MCSTTHAPHPADGVQSPAYRLTNAKCTHENRRQSLLRSYLHTRTKKSNISARRRLCRVAGTREESEVQARRVCDLVVATPWTSPQDLASTPYNAFNSTTPALGSKYRTCLIIIIIISYYILQNTSHNEALPLLITSNTYGCRSYMP